MIMNMTKTLLTAILLASGAALAQGTPAIVPVNFQKIYVPDGFDSNDHVQFMGEGQFQNSCYRHHQSRVEVDKENKIISVRPVAYKYPGLCLQWILPFNRVVDVGILPAGNYKIVQSSDGTQLGAAHIKEATRLEADDYLYAPINQALIVGDKGSYKLYMDGEFAMSCMKTKEVKFQIQRDVIVVQPIAEIDTSTPCLPGAYPFQSSVDIGLMAPGKYLLHVRSMDGKAINTLFQANF